MTFVNSTIKNGTVRRCKELFHIGTSKTQELIKNSIEYGYVNRVGNDLVADSVRFSCGYHYVINDVKKAITFDKKKVVSTSIRLKDIVSLIRNAVILNHISKQNKCIDTITCVESNQSMNKRTRKTARKMQCQKAYRTLSYRRIMDITKSSIYYSRKTVLELLKSEKITKEEVSIETDVNPMFGEDLLIDKKQMAFNREAWKESGKRGFIYYDYIKNKIMVRVGTAYTLNCNDIQLVLSQKK